MFAEMKLSDLLEKIAAKTPTPGGGSVSATVGALGAALGVMTARYSEASEAESILDELKKEFLVLVDSDAEAYGQVNSAMSLPKDSDDTKRRRKEALQIALGEASEIPLKGMLLASRGLRALAELLTDKVRRGRLEKELARLLDEGKTAREQVRKGVELLYAGK